MPCAAAFSIVASRRVIEREHADIVAAVEGERHVRLAQHLMGRRGSRKCSLSGMLRILARPEYS